MLILTSVTLGAREVALIVQQAGRKASEHTLPQEGSAI